MLIADLGELFRLELTTFVLTGNELAIVDAVVGIFPSHHGGLVDGTGPPAQVGHAVFHGPGREPLLLPALNQGLDVFRFQTFRLHFPEAHVMQCPRGLHEDILPGRPGPVGGTRCPAHHPTQFVFQILHALLTLLPLIHPTPCALFRARHSALVLPALSTGFVIGTDTDA